MDTEALETLIQNGETQMVEFKIAPPRIVEMAERLCGFANSITGGMVIIGVADKTWDIVGVKSASDACDNILQSARKCKPPVPLNSAHPQVVEINGKKLVIAQVLPNNGTLYQAGGAYWLRRGTQTSAMETAELVRFVYQKGIIDWETQPITRATIDDLNLDKVSEYQEYRAATNRRPSRLSDPVELLIKLNCAVLLEGGIHSDKPIVRPTNAGLLLFGHAPEDFLTQAEIVATFYQDSSGVRRYTDRKILAGTVAEQIDQAGEFLQRWTPVSAHVDGFRRIDEPALPVEALREAVINAVVHRDYSLAGTAVRIFYYPDRVEIYNPGLLLPGISIEQLQQGIAASKPRNPIISGILRDLPGGYMERVGSGIRFMINQMRTYGLPDPQFKEQDEFVVTFLRADENENESDTGNKPYGVQSELPLYIQSANPSTPLREATPKRLLPTSEALSDGPAQRQALALQYVRENGFITHKQYRVLTGASETTAIRDLDALVARNALRKVGKGPSRRYLI